MRQNWSVIIMTHLGLCGLLVLTGCPAADATASKTPVLGLTSRAADETAASIPSNNEVLVAQVLKLINERRSAIGLPEVALDPVLTSMAEAYATEMIEKGFFAHENPTNDDGPGERAYKAGYVFLEIGENLAAGQETAEQVVSEWMASPEHRDMILGMQWREVGIGVRLGGQYDVYWVLEFGNPP